MKEIAADTEQRIQDLGRGLLSEARSASDKEAGHSQEDKLLDRLMADESLRVQVLRFVDVLPVLSNNADLVHHLEEYLGDRPMPIPIPGLSLLPGLVSWGLRHTQGGLAAHAVAAAVRAIVKRLARRFIAGNDVTSIAQCLYRLHRRGMGFTLDLLGEATVSEAEAKQYQQAYLSLLEGLAPSVERWEPNPLLDTINGRRSPRLNVSVKVTSLYSQLDAADTAGGATAVKNRLRPILQLAKHRGAFITLDMEQYDTKEIALRVFQEVLVEPEFHDWPDAGIALQAYLRDTEADLTALIDWAGRRGCPVTVRLVRGAYWDYETVIARQHNWPVPVWTHKWETDACYERCLHLLLAAHPYVEAAVGTHNVRSLAAALVIAQDLDLRPQQYELQMLYGMADPLKQVLVDRGQRLRVYTPFGQLIPGMAYLVRRLLENTSSQSFLRMGFAQNVPPEVALAPPHPPDLRISATPRDHKLPPADAPFENEPVHRLTDSAQRQAFQSAIKWVHDKLGRDYPLIIAGQRHQSQQWIVSINPARPQEIIGRAASASQQDAHTAVQAAAAAFEAWRNRPAHDRADYLLRAAAVLRQRRDELAAWEIFEAGKNWREADADVTEAIDFLEYYARQALRLSLGLTMNVPGEDNQYFYEPRGVGAVIAPWNFPLAIVTGMASAAIATGNTVVLKPAPQTPIVASKLVEVFEQVGLPPGVLNYLPGSDEAGEALVRHPAVHFVAFTGSQAVGCRINALGAQFDIGQDHLKRVIAEMGGKNAIIVDNDADLDEAVRGVVMSAFSYQGQKCSAASRVIVVGDLYQSLLQRLVEATASLRIGLPEQPGTFLGPVIDAESRDRIRIAIEAGKRVAKTAIEVVAEDLGDGYFIGPTIFTDVPPDSPLAQEEIFGPVLAVMRARSFTDALDLANNTRYGLTGGVYSRSPTHLTLVRKRFRVGNLYLNRKITGAVVGRQPFGGIKMSGIGNKAGGPDYLLQFLECRSVSENTLRRGFAPE